MSFQDQHHGVEKTAGPPGPPNWRHCPPIIATSVIGISLDLGNLSENRRSEFLGRMLRWFGIETPHPPHTSSLGVPCLHSRSRFPDKADPPLPWLITVS